MNEAISIRGFPDRAGAAQAARKVPAQARVCAAREASAAVEGEVFGGRPSAFDRALVDDLEGRDTGC